MLSEIQQTESKLRYNKLFLSPLSIIFIVHYWTCTLSTRYSISVGNSSGGLKKECPGETLRRVPSLLSDNADLVGMENTTKLVHTLTINKVKIRSPF